MATAVLDNYVHTNHNHVIKKKSHIVDSYFKNVAIDPKQLIGEALHKRVESVDYELCEPGDEDTFFVADLGEVYRQHLRWKTNLPRIKPFYGMFPCSRFPPQGSFFYLACYNN